MSIQSYDDFISELFRAGFSIAGERSEGVFSLSPQFGDRIHWHTDDPDTDPWEWRMRVLEERDDIAYGKLFFKRGGFITREWYPHFLAVRRKGKSFDEAYEDGTVSYEAKRIYEIVKSEGPIALHLLKGLGGFSRPGSSRFDSSLIELQMRMFVTICGRRYRSALNTGWSSTVLCTTESFFGEEVFDAADSLDEQKSYDRIAGQIQSLNPMANPKKVKRFICG